MKELSLNFHRNEDKTPVSFNSSEVELVGEAIKKVVEIKNNFLENYEKGTIKNSIFTDFERNLEIIFSFFNYHEKVKLDIERNSFTAQTRQYQNDQLRSLLDKPVTSEDVREKIKVLSDEIEMWWRVHGTASLVKVSFHNRGVILKISGYIHDGYDENGNKVKKDDIVSKLKDRGIIFNGEKDTLVMNDNNLKILEEIIQTTFPNADIRGVENYNYGEYVIKDLDVQVPYKDLHDFDFKVEPIHDEGAYDHRYLKTEKEKVNKSFNSLSAAIGTLVNFYNKGDLNVGFSQTLLSSMENYSLDLFSLFGYEGIFNKRKEDTYAEIRNTNIENRNLRIQLGNKVKNSEIEETIKLLHDKLTEWWGKEMGHIADRDIRFHSYGATMEMYCGISDYFGNGRKRDESYISTEDKCDKFRELGLSFDESNERFYDTIENREYLKGLISERFTHYHIDSVVSDWTTIKSVTITVEDWDTI